MNGFTKQILDDPAFRQSMKRTIVQLLNQDMDEAMTDAQLIYHVIKGEWNDSLRAKGLPVNP